MTNHDATTITKLIDEVIGHWELQMHRATIHGFKDLAHTSDLALIDFRLIRSFIETRQEYFTMAYTYAPKPDAAELLKVKPS
jgi:hypothetical protein